MPPFGMAYYSYISQTVSQPDAGVEAPGELVAGVHRDHVLHLPDVECSVSSVKVRVCSV